MLDGKIWSVLFNLDKWWDGQPSRHWDGMNKWTSHATISTTMCKHGKGRESIQTLEPRLCVCVFPKKHSSVGNNNDLRKNSNNSNNINNSNNNSNNYGYHYINNNKTKTVKIKQL
jgi:hypothetical protein